MNRWIALCLGALLSLPALADLELPRVSPKAKVTQTVGLTDISINYSSPGVKGRTIWGALVPYDQVWRAGANDATQIIFSRDVTIAGTAVAAGSYGFYVIPGHSKWTLILNRDANAFGAFQYDKSKDVVRVEVQPQAIPLRERLAYLVTDFNDDAASISLEWEKVRVSLPVALQTDKQARANIKESVDEAWQPLSAAARYLLEKKEYATGLQYADKSIALTETWQNDWVKAQLLAATGKHREAIALAQKAQTLGQKTPDNFFAAEQVKKALADWKNNKS